MYAGLDRSRAEMKASENDGPISAFFLKVSRDFVASTEAEVQFLISLYKEVGKTIDALAQYFGDEPTRFSFEQVMTTLLSFIRMFRTATLDNSKMQELEKKKAKETSLVHEKAKK